MDIEEETKTVAEEAINELSETTEESLKQLLMVLFEKYHEDVDADAINDIFAAGLIDSLFRVMAMIDPERRNNFITIIEDLVFKMKLSKSDLELYNLPTEGKA